MAAYLQQKALDTRNIAIFWFWHECIDDQKFDELC